jgi:lipopolysaccharide export LptBFGC system permease protein LptF
MEEMSGEDKKWYFKSMGPKTGRMKSIRIWERVGGIQKLITAEEGELNFFHEWTSLKLYNGTIRQADKKDPLKGYVVGNFAEDEMVLDISGSLDKKGNGASSSPRNMSRKEIRKELKKINEELKSPGISSHLKKSKKYKRNDHLVELYKKISIPFACLAFGLIGVPVGLMVRRGGRMIGLGVGVGLITLYYVVLTAGEKIAKVWIYPPFLGAWTPNILTLIAGVILIIRTVRETPIRSSRWINKLFSPENRYRTDAEERR